jgi:hypothetical protein
MLFLDILLWGTAIFLLVVFVVALYKLFRMTTQVVPQEQRYVIYRMGKFDRILGPGPVTIFPSVDKVEKIIKVHDHPHEINMQGIIAYGVPNDLKVNFWCKYDIEQAAGKNRRKLLEFVQVSEAERRQQVQAKLHEALVRQIAEIEQRMPLPSKATLMDRVAALAPGSPRYNELLKGLKFDLSRVLPTIGVVLSQDHPVLLTGRNIADEIADAIKRQRGREMDSEWLMKYAGELRKEFPGISNSMLAQMLLSIEGIDVGTIQRLFVDQNGDAQAKVEVETSADGTSRPKVVVKPSAQKQKSARLTESDLSVLKRVPRAVYEERMRA